MSFFVPFLAIWRGASRKAGKFVLGSGKFPLFPLFSYGKQLVTCRKATPHPLPHQMPTLCLSPQPTLQLSSSLALQLCTSPTLYTSYSLPLPLSSSPSNQWQPPQTVGISQKSMYDRCLKGWARTSYGSRSAFMFIRSFIISFIHSVSQTRSPPHV